MPRPLSPASSSHSSVDRLEARAAAMSAPSPALHAHTQFAIKQHISTDLKSLYRLAKAAGMDREEFVRVVERELEVLSIFDDQDDLSG
jgi:hypothetical protein